MSIVKAAAFALVVVCSLLAGASPARSAEGGAGTGVVAGTVRGRGGEVVSDADVELIHLHRHAATDDAGAFRFDAVPPGHYFVQVVSPRHGSAVVEVQVTAGAVSEVPVELAIAVHEEQIAVSAAPDASSLARISRPVVVLEGPELQARVQPTLGETLAQEPGISSTSYSPGASRPVIRGLGGDRIRILQDGIGVGDASNVSEDHAVSTDTLATRRIEIVRGAATLMYGSNAIGGVVNVIDNRIPDHLPSKPVHGDVNLGYGSASTERKGGVALDGGFASFGWHLDGSVLEADDVETPIGTLANGDIETTSGTAGGSWIGERGFVGLSWGRFESEYGIPTDEGVRIDMSQDRYDLRGELNTPLGILRAVRVRLAQVDYEHAEIEADGATGTQFLIDSWEGRLELPHRQLGPFRGAFGFQSSSRDSEALGEEAIAPPTETRNDALFIVEELGSGAVTYNVGARYERQENEATPNASFPDPGPSRSFDSFSASAGLVWQATEHYAVALTLSRATRPPNAEELYVNGPHHATFQFEVGDPGLDRETSLGVDLSLRKQQGRASGEIDLFLADFDDYIFLSPTGDVVDVEEEEFPVFQFLQDDTRFWGAEAHVDFDVLDAEPHHLQVELRGDYVRAELRDGGLPLPKIPPLRGALGLRYRGTRLGGLVELASTSRQDRVAAFETETDDFRFVNASVDYRLFAGDTIHELTLSGRNLTDRLGRNHLSPLKDFVPLAGRDVRLSYRLTF